LTPHQDNSRSVRKNTEQNRIERNIHVEAEETGQRPWQTFSQNQTRLWFRRWPTAVARLSPWNDLWRTSHVPPNGETYAVRRISSLRSRAAPGCRR
jgi:hypothetical protein